VDVVLGCSIISQWEFIKLGDLHRSRFKLGFSRTSSKIRCATQITWTQNWTSSNSWTRSVDPKFKLRWCNRPLILYKCIGLNNGQDDLPLNRKEIYNNSSTQQTRYSAESLCSCTYMWHQTWMGSVLSEDGICFKHIKRIFWIHSNTASNYSVIYMYVNKQIMGNTAINVNRLQLFFLASQLNSVRCEHS